MSKLLVNCINQKGTNNVLNLIPGNGILFDFAPGVASVNLKDPAMVFAGEISCVIRNEWDAGYEKNNNTIVGICTGNLKIDGWQTFAKNDKILIDANGIFGLFAVVNTGSLTSTWQLEKIDTPRDGSIFYICNGRLYGNTNQIITNGHCAMFSRVTEQKIVNVGDGVKIYNGRNGTDGTAEFATLCAENGITLTKCNNNLLFSIDAHKIDITQCKNYKNWVTSEDSDNIKNLLDGNIASAIMNVNVTFSSTLAKLQNEYTEKYNIITKKLESTNLAISDAKTVTNNSNLAISNLSDELSAKHDAVCKELAGTIKHNNVQFESIAEKIAKLENQKEIVNNTTTIVTPCDFAIIGDEYIKINKTTNDFYLSFSGKSFNDQFIGINSELKNNAVSLQKINEKEKNNAETIASVKNEISVINGKIETLAKMQPEKIIVKEIIQQENTGNNEFIVSQLAALQEQMRNNDATIDSIKRMQTMLMTKLNNAQSAQSTQGLQNTQNNDSGLAKETIANAKNNTITLTTANGECRNTKENAIPQSVSFFEFTPHFTLSGDFNVAMPKTPSQGQLVYLYNNTDYTAIGAVFVPPRQSASYIFNNGYWRKL